MKLIRVAHLKNVMNVGLLVPKTGIRKSLFVKTVDTTKMLILRQDVYWRNVVKKSLV